MSEGQGGPTSELEERGMQAVVEVQEVATLTEMTEESKRLGELETEGVVLKDKIAELEQQLAEQKQETGIVTTAVVANEQGRAGSEGVADAVPKVGPSGPVDVASETILQNAEMQLRQVMDMARQAAWYKSAADDLYSKLSVYQQMPLPQMQPMAQMYHAPYDCYASGGGVGWMGNGSASHMSNGGVRGRGRGKRA